MENFDGATLPSTLLLWIGCQLPTMTRGNVLDLGYTKNKSRMLASLFIVLWTLSRSALFIMLSRTNRNRDTQTQKDKIHTNRLEQRNKTYSLQYLQNTATEWDRLIIGSDFLYTPLLTFFSTNYFCVDLVTKVYADVISSSPEITRHSNTPNFTRNNRKQTSVCCHQWIAVKFVSDSLSAFQVPMKRDGTLFLKKTYKLPFWLLTALIITRNTKLTWWLPQSSSKRVYEFKIFGVMVSI